MEADTPTIRLGATPSGLTSAHLHQTPQVRLIPLVHKRVRGVADDTNRHFTSVHDNVFSLLSTEHG